MNKFFKTSLAFLIAIFTIAIPAYGIQRGGPGHSTPDIQNRVTVGGWGANYSTIQGAIDGITDASTSNWYTIQIAPGIYDENIVGKDYVGITGVGAGSNDDVKIRATSGTVYTAPSNESSLDNIVLELNPTASGGKVIDATGGGTHWFFRNVLKVTSATNGITATILDADCDEILYARNNIEYLMTGSDAGANTHDIINIDGSTQLVMSTGQNTVTVGDVDDDVNYILFNSTGIFVHGNFFTTIIITNGAYSGTAGILKATKNTDFKFTTQSVFNLIGNESGTGIAVQIDTDTNDGIFDTGFNNYTVSGFATNLYADAATGDTINSAFDFNPGELLTTGEGTVNFLGSFAYGEVGITGGGAFTIDTANAWHYIDTLTEGNSSFNVDVNAGLTGPIAAFADYSGTVAGTVSVTDVDHGLTGTEYVSITGTTNYNDVFVITVINTDSYYFTHSWDGDDATGTWRHGSEVVINQRGTYLVSWAFSASADGANKTYNFSAFNGITPISGTLITRNFSTANDIGSVAGVSITALEKGDHIYFAIKNTTDATNPTISEGNLTISKVN